MRLAADYLSETDVLDKPVLRLKQCVQKRDKPVDSESSLRVDKVFVSTPPPLVWGSASQKDARSARREHGPDEIEHRLRSAARFETTREILREAAEVCLVFIG